MPDKDYEDVLSGNVDEAKEAIKEMEDPDYSAILEAEKNNKDRKTLKQFLERNMDEETEKQDTGEQTEKETEKTESVDLSEMQDQGTLGSMSFTQVLVIGGVIGLLAGAAIGYSLSPTASSGSPQKAQQAVKDLVTAGGFNGTVNVDQPERRHGMYYFNITFERETVNGTETGSQQAYVTTDGELFFPVVDSFFMQSPINIQQRIAQQQNSEPAQPGGQ